MKQLEGNEDFLDLKKNNRSLQKISLIIINSVLINSKIINPVLVKSKIINSVLINSIIINPVLINSKIINSVLINTKIINPVLSTNKIRQNPSKQAEFCQDLNSSDMDERGNCSLSRNFLWVLKKVIADTQRVVLKRTYFCTWVLFESFASFALTP